VRPLAFVIVYFIFVSFDTLIQFETSGVVCLKSLGQDVAIFSTDICTFPTYGRL